MYFILIGDLSHQLIRSDMNKSKVIEMSTLDWDNGDVWKESAPVDSDDALGNNACQPV